MTFNQKIKYLLPLVGLVIFITFVVIPAFTGTRPVVPDYYIGPVRIHMYSWIMLGAVIASFFIAKKLAGTASVEARHIENLIIINTLAGLVGARLYHIATAWEYYSQNFIQVFVVWQGGLGIFGGILAGILATVIYSKIVGISFFRLADILSPALAFGLALGRWGNFFNYEAYGSPTELPWKMFVPAAYRLQNYLDKMYYHPVFLYESLYLFGLGCLLYLFFLKRNGLHGYVFSVFLLLYFIGRLLLDRFRIDSSLSENDLNEYFILSAVVVSVILYFYLKQRRLQKV